MLEIEEGVYEDMLKVFGRTKESMELDVTTIREWMKTQPHLPEVLDDKRIQNFLLMNKCSVERAKYKIDNYYIIRSLTPEMYENFNPKHPNFKISTERVCAVILPQLTKQHHRVALFKFRTDQTEPYEPLFVIQRLLHLQELRLSEDHMFGDILIVDGKGGTLAHVLKYTITLIAQANTIYEKVFSLRIKAAYVVNTFPAVDIMLKMIKTFIKPKLIKRVHICSDYKILHEIFGKEMLPVNYGGTEKSVEELQDMINKKLEEMADRFDKLDALKVDESLRPEKLENDHFLGFYGNFKKLEID